LNSLLFSVWINIIDVLLTNFLIFNFC
jgi:hypothetical protein